jgi:hypothetical protein
MKIIEELKYRHEFKFMKDTLIEYAADLIAYLFPNLFKGWQDSDEWGVC